MEYRRITTIAVSAFIAALIIGVGFWVWQRTQTPQIHLPQSSLESNQARASIERAISLYSTSTELYIVPVETEIPILSAGRYESFSYYGMTFDVPWTEVPIIQTSSPTGVLTFIEFHDEGKLIEAFASTSSISPIVNGALSSVLTGIGQEGSSTLFAMQQLYRPELESDFSFVSSSLDSTPSQLSLDNARARQSLFAAVGLVAKDQILSALETDLLPIQNVSAILCFSNSQIKGFEFVGTLDVGSTTHNVTHFLLFDSTDRSFNLLTESTTQNENDFLLSTMKLE